MKKTLTKHRHKPIVHGPKPRSPPEWLNSFMILDLRHSMRHVCPFLRLRFSAHNRPIAPPFFHLLSALKAFAAQPPYTLPLSSTLPDMKASTQLYITLQSLYKDQAEREKNVFKSLISPDVQISDDLIDAFVKNAHGLKIIRGSCWDSLDKNTIALGQYTVPLDPMTWLIGYIYM